MLTLAENVIHERFLALSFVLLFFSLYRWPARRLDHIPAVGTTSQFFSFFGAVQFLFDARRVIRRGCEQYSEGIFRVPTLERWVVIINKPDLTREVRRVPEDVISSMAFANELLHFELTLGPTIMSDRYHITGIRTQLTKNLETVFPALRKEVIDAFNDLIPAGENEWLTLEAMKPIQQIANRASSSVFVGPSLCRNDDYLELCSSFPMEVGKTGLILKYTLPFLRRFVFNRFTSLPGMVARGVKHLRPLIHERRQLLAENSPDKPNDFLTWLMELKDHSDEELTRRMLEINLVAIGNVAMTFFLTLYNLAEHPEYAMVLREEVEEVVRREGWTHAAIAKLVKIDSFIKETLRFDDSHLWLPRLVLQPFTFSNGAYLPPGTVVAIAVQPVHTDESNYSSPLSFEPFRHLDETRKENVGRKVDMTATHVDYLSFGNGRHACPGRFFAANQVKLMLAILVTTYDVALEASGKQTHSQPASANLRAKFLFRRR